MEAQVGSCLCLRAKRVARRLGWQGVGFADGAAKTGQLDLARLPWASTVGSSGMFMIIRVIANVVGNYKGGQTLIWLHWSGGLCLLCLGRTSTNLSH